VTTRRAIVAALPPEGGEVVLSDDSARHLTRVLRLGAGDRLELTDGRGGVAEAVLEGVGPDGRLRARAKPARREAPRPEVVLLLAVLKGPAMDDAVRMATEAGMTRLVPVETARSVPRGTRPDRWIRIAEAAAAQCGRADVPAIDAPTPLADALAATAHLADRRIAHPGAPRRSAAAESVAVLVGPEGGLTEAEVARAVAEGWMPVGLAPHVLRACTAAAVAVASAAPG
jgi:16S rRNA (uracil1498-N3)-methyltransferase